MSEPRLGDRVDDYCSRCRLLTNHSIVSLADGAPSKVHCRTCYYEHRYRQGQSGAKKTSSRKAQLFDAVLTSIVGEPAAAEPAPKPNRDAE